MVVRVLISVYLTREIVSPLNGAKRRVASSEQLQNKKTIC